MDTTVKFGLAVMRVPFECDYYASIYLQTKELIYQVYEVWQIFIFEMFNCLRLMFLFSVLLYLTQCNHVTLKTHYVQKWR